MKQKHNHQLCHYCNEYEQVTKDHKKAKADGGSNKKGNIVWSCGACNQLKADLPYEVFITIPKAVLKRYKGLWKKNQIHRKQQRKQKNG